MRDKLLMGVGRAMVPVPGMVWKDHVAKGAQDTVAKLGFMSDEHHRVRDFAVRELPRVGKRLPPELIAQELDLPISQVIELLDDLEENMTFLYRGDGRSVTWAYPVTVDRTPHQVTLNTGEEVYAA